MEEFKGANPIENLGNNEPLIVGYRSAFDDYAASIKQVDEQLKKEGVQKFKSLWIDVAETELYQANTISKLYRAVQKLIDLPAVESEDEMTVSMNKLLEALNAESNFYELENPALVMMAHLAIKIKSQLDQISSSSGK